MKRYSNKTAAAVAFAYIVCTLRFAKYAKKGGKSTAESNRENVTKKTRIVGVQQHKNENNNNNNRVYGKSGSRCATEGGGRCIISFDVRT